MLPYVSQCRYLIIQMQTIADAHTPQLFGQALLACLGFMMPMIDDEQHGKFLFLETREQLIDLVVANLAGSVMVKQAQKPKAARRGQKRGAEEPLDSGNGGEDGAPHEPAGVPEVNMDAADSPEVPAEVPEAAKASAASAAQEVDKGAGKAARRASRGSSAAALSKSLKLKLQQDAQAFEAILKDGEPRQRKVTDEIIHRVFGPLEKISGDKVILFECLALMIKGYRFVFHGSLVLVEQPVPMVQFSKVLQFMTARSIELHWDHLTALHAHDADVGSDDDDLKDRRNEKLRTWKPYASNRFCNTRLFLTELMTRGRLVNDH